MQRLVPSIQRLFQSNEYRVFNPYEATDTVSSNLVFYSKRSNNLHAGNNITFTKPKLFVVRAAAVKANISFLKLSEEQDIFNGNKREKSVLDILPKELLIHILSYVDICDVISFAQTCRTGRVYAYDNILWKALVFKTWQNPFFMHVTISSTDRMLQTWFNRHTNNTYSADQIALLFQQNCWRILYITYISLDLIPSLIYPLSPMFNRRTTQCFASTRSVNYTSSMGGFKLKGVQQVSRVEFSVCNFVMRPWYRREYANFIPLAIFSLRDYGLRMARSLRGQHTRGFFRRRGYYLKTDQNRKLHLTYRYFPTMRFRLFKQEQQIYLLCQDLYLNGGETSECYTMYEIMKESDPPSDVITNVEVLNTLPDDDENISRNEERVIESDLQIMNVESDETE